MAEEVQMRSVPNVRNLNDSTVATGKSQFKASVTLTDDVTSPKFRNARHTRILNTTAGQIVVTIFEENPESPDSFLECEDIGDITIAAGMSKEIGTKAFSSAVLQARVASGTAAVVIVTAE